MAPIPRGITRLRPGSPRFHPISGACFDTVRIVDGTICRSPIPTASNGDMPKISIVGTTIHPHPTPQ